METNFFFVLRYLYMHSIEVGMRTAKLGRNNISHNGDVSMSTRFHSISSFQGCEDNIRGLIIQEHKANAFS